MDHNKFILNKLFPELFNFFFSETFFDSKDNASCRDVDHQDNELKVEEPEEQSSASCSSPDDSTTEIRDFSEGKRGLT